MLWCRILADEMGMGKTIQAISVIVTHRTDDMSRLPPVTPAAGTAPRKSAAAAARPRLALPGAPPREGANPNPAGAGPAGAAAGGGAPGGGGGCGFGGDAGASAAGPSCAGAHIVGYFLGA